MSEPEGETASLDDRLLSLLACPVDDRPGRVPRMSGTPTESRSC
jgi:uncharacterized protein YbaR (Trm112 family)